MKKVLALVIVAIMLATMAPLALAASTVDVTVVIDGKIEVYAHQVTVTDMTLNGALVAAHKALYKDGDKGYVANSDNTWKIFLVTKCWGIEATPFLLINNEPLGADSAKGFADTFAIKSGDNIIITTSTDAQANPAKPITLKATVSGDKATITATEWTLNMSTYAYTNAPYAKGEVVDKAGKALGTTDAKGVATVTIPADGIICIKGLAAIKVAAGTTTPTPSTPPAATPKVVLSSQAVKVNGVAKSMEVYNIDGSNYFKLRDLAYVLNGTKSQFSVSYDDAKKAITCTTGAAYTANGTELVIGADKSSTAVASTQSIMINGAAANLKAFNIGGSNFIKLRDMGTALNFNVNYDEATKTMLITSVA